MTYESKPWLRFYEQGVGPEIDIPEVTLKDWVERIDRDFPERPAFHFLGVTWTYRKLMENADRFAQALNEHGIGKGDILAIHLVNSPQYLIAIIGAIKAGVIFSGLSPLLTAEEMFYQLSDSGAKAIITLDNLFEEKLAGIANKLHNLKLVVVTKLLDFVEAGRPVSAPKELPGKKVRWLKGLLSHYLARPPKVTIAPEDTSCIQYTGGTTGVPKGAVLNHRNIVANVSQYGAWLKTEMGREVILCGFPMFHVAGLFHVMQSLAYAFTQVLVPNPRDTKHIIQEMARCRPTFMAAVPTLYLLLLREPEFQRLDFSGLETCMCGAAPFPVEKIKDLEEVVGPSKLIEVFGMTETSPLLTANPKKGLKKAGSVGLPLPSTWLKLVDPETGQREVLRGEEGEIIARGPQVMKGYFNKPQETAAVLREHNGELWMHTGDVARMDEDGFFFIVDRAKDMINVGGYKVFSSEVEHKLSENPAIELCALVGVPNPERPGSELVKLVVQKSQSHRDKPDDVVREQLEAFARERLAPYKVPKIIEFLERMPLTSVGKIDKKALRSQASKKS